MPDRLQPPERVQKLLDVVKGKIRTGAHFLQENFQTASEHAGQEAERITHVWKTSPFAQHIDELRAKSAALGIKSIGYAKSHRREFIGGAIGIVLAITTGEIITRLPSKRETASRPQTTPAEKPTPSPNETLPNPQTDENLPTPDPEKAQPLSIKDLLSDPAGYFNNQTDYYVLSDELFIPDVSTQISSNIGITDFNLAKVQYKKTQSAQETHTATDAVIGALTSFDPIEDTAQSVPLLLAFTTDQGSIEAIIADATKQAPLGNVYIRLVWLDHLDIDKNSQIAENIPNIPRIFVQIVKAESA